LYSYGHGSPAVPRSRPHHKNNNCYVESKNWTLVRRRLGYRRFDTREQLAVLQQLETLLARRANVLQPSMALLEKTLLRGVSAPVSGYTLDSQRGIPILFR